MRSYCPDESALRRLTLCDDDGGSAFGIDLTLHIESCDRCQKALESLAAAEREGLLPLFGAGAWTSDEPGFPTLSDFRIVRELGRGGRSVVCLAEELSTSRLVALKLIPIAEANSAAQRSEWIAEVRAAASVEHQNVVRLYRVEEAEKWFLLVFEFVSGGTLRDWLTTSASQKQIARFVQTLAKAVSQIHQKKILHLDLKPSNILMDISAGRTWEEIVPKVSDFGISSGPNTGLAGNHAAALVRGTPAYMAPEQFLGDPALLTVATDVYGLGGLIYCMLTGRPPNSGEGKDLQPETWLTSEVTPPEKLDPRIDAKLSAIVMRCLQKHPEQRYATPIELAEALQCWIDEQTTVLAPLHAVRRLSKPNWTWAIACLLMCGVLCVIIARSSFWSESSRSAIAASPGQIPHSTQRATTLPDAVDRILDGHSVNPVTQFDVAHLIQELSDLPPAFSIERAARLVVENRGYTDHLLSKLPVSADECLRFGTLQHAAGNRFDQNGPAELYSMTRYLVEDSVRLLTAVVAQNPDDQAALERLIASQVLLASIRIDKGENNAESVLQHLRESTGKLRPAVPSIARLTDRPQRVFWAGMLLDKYREQFWQSLLSDDIPSASRFAEWELEAWQAFALDHDVPDLQFRHSLMNTHVESPGWGTVQNMSWVLEESREETSRESAYLFMASHFFDEVRKASHLTSDALAARAVEPWSKMIEATAEYLKQRNLHGLSPQLLIHEDLIRPLTTFSTRHRSDGKLESAEQLQRCYLALCDAADRVYPSDANVHLALSEAYLQAWKNSLRRESRSNAIDALQRSLREAQIAIELSPTSVRARDQVADRMKRLARFETSASPTANAVVPATSM